MEDAGASVTYYLVVGIDAIDTKLGKGYAKAHPELLGKFIQPLFQNIVPTVLQKPYMTLQRNFNINN